MSEATCSDDKVMQALERVAQCWCEVGTQNIVMDAVLAVEFAKVLLAEMDRPRLDRASDQEFFDELKSRGVYAPPVTTPILTASLSTDPTQPKEVLCQISHP